MVHYKTLALIAKELVQHWVISFSVDKDEMRLHVLEPKMVEDIAKENHLPVFINDRKDCYFDTEISTIYEGIKVFAIYKEGSR